MVFGSLVQTAAGTVETGSALGEAMDVAAQSLVAGAPVLLLHLLVTLAILVIGVGLYVLLTPHKELRLVREGNMAAALSLGGVIVGLAIPLSASMRSSLSWADVLIWGVVTLLAQLLVFRFVDALLPGLSRRISEADAAAAILLVAIKLATAFVLAAAVDGAPV